MADLKRTLGFPTILALAIASIMGTGIFFGPSIAAEHAGNASLISWIILTVIALYIAACFAELGAMFPKAGGIYEYSKQAYGHFISFMMGWIGWLVGNITSVLLIVAATDYLLPDPRHLMYRLLLAMGILILLNLIAFFGIEASGIILILFAVIQVGVLVFVIAAGIPHVSMANFTPFITVSPLFILIGIFFISESFFGWESVAYLSEETKRPEKVIPQSLMIGTLIVGVLGIAVTAVSLGAIPWNILAGMHAPLSEVAAIGYGALGSTIVGIGVFLALVGSAAGAIITMPRLLLALARDKLFIGQLSEIHKDYNTPYKAIQFQILACLIILAIGFGKYKLLLSLLIPLGFIMYVFVLLAVPVLRLKRPNEPRPFRAPLGKFLPLVMVLFLILLTFSWATNTTDGPKLLLLGLAFTITAIPLYLLLKIFYDPDIIIKAYDSFAVLTLFTEGVNLPASIKNEIISILGDIRGKRVMEFGCSVGTLTIHLADQVGENGVVYATNISKQELNIVERRIKRMGLNNVRVIHDVHQVNRVPPQVHDVDAVVSIGMLSYIQDKEKVLSEIRNILPEGGKICFVDYTNIFQIIPDVDWLSNDLQIEEKFKKCGFSVHVMRKKGVLWNYLFVYGIKYGEDVPVI